MNSSPGSRRLCCQESVCRFFKLQKNNPSLACSAYTGLPVKGRSQDFSGKKKKKNDLLLDKHLLRNV